MKGLNGSVYLVPGMKWPIVFWSQFFYLLLYAAGAGDRKSKTGIKYEYSHSGWNVQRVCKFRLQSHIKNVSTDAVF